MNDKKLLFIILSVLSVLSLTLVAYHIGELKGTLHTGMYCSEALKEKQYEVFNNFVSLDTHLDLLNESKNFEIKYYLCESKYANEVLE